MDCPKCNSNNTASFPMVYKSESRSASGSVGVLPSHINSQSLLAAQLSPPAMPEPNAASGFLLLFVVALCFIFFTGISAAVNPSLTAGGAVVGLVVGVLAAVPVHRYFEKARKEKMKSWQKAFDVWSASWVCLRCGERWIKQDVSHLPPSSFEPARTGRVNRRSRL